MIKIVKRPDGSEERIEGTAEEVAAYERALQEQNVERKDESVKKPGILKGKEIEELVRRAVERMYGPWPWLTTTAGTSITYTSPCSICGKFGCLDTHVTFTDGTIRYGTSFFIDDMTR